MLVTLLLNHSYGALTHLRRIPPLSYLLCHGSNLSRKGASGKPGEVQTAPDQNRHFNLPLAWLWLNFVCVVRQPCPSKQTDLAQ